MLRVWEAWRHHFRLLPTSVQRSSMETGWPVVRGQWLVTHAHIHTHTCAYRAMQSYSQADNLFSRHLHASCIFHKHLKGFHYNTHPSMYIYTTNIYKYYKCVCVCVWLYLCTYETTYGALGQDIFKPFCCNRTYYIFACNAYPISQLWRWYKKNIESIIIILKVNAAVKFFKLWVKG